jgi:hypothetical protein
MAGRSPNNSWRNNPERKVILQPLEKSFVFPIFSIARIGGNAQIILGFCKNYFKHQKNAFEIILVYRNISIF